MFVKSSHPETQKKKKSRFVPSQRNTPQALLFLHEAQKRLRYGHSVMLVRHPVHARLVDLIPQDAGLVPHLPDLPHDLLGELRVALHRHHLPGDQHALHGTGFGLGQGDGVGRIREDGVVVHPVDSLYIPGCAPVLPSVSPVSVCLHALLPPSLSLQHQHPVTNPTSHTRWSQKRRGKKRGKKWKSQTIFSTPKNCFPSSDSSTSVTLTSPPPGLRSTGTPRARPTIWSPMHTPTTRTRPLSSALRVYSVSAKIQASSPKALCRDPVMSTASTSSSAGYASVEATTSCVLMDTSSGSAVGAAARSKRYVNTPPYVLKRSCVPGRGVSAMRMARRVGGAAAAGWEPIIDEGRRGGKRSVVVV